MTGVRRMPLRRVEGQPFAFMPAQRTGCRGWSDRL